MGQRRIYFQNGDIVVASKGRRKNCLKFNKQYEQIPYKFTPYTRKEIDMYWEKERRR